MRRATLLLIALAAIACAENKTPKAERPAVAVEVSRVAAGDVKESIAVVGSLTPKFQGDVKPEYSGTIVDVYVTEWVHVAKGTLLARFDVREPEAALKSATAAKLTAEVGATRAKRELERTGKLKAAGLATQQNLDDARSAADAAEAQLAAAKAQEQMARTRIDKTEVRAPMSGVVSARMVNPGDFVQNMGSGNTMFSIVDNKRLELTVAVPSSQIATVKLGQPLTFTTDAVPGREFTGRVTFINPAADEASRTVKVIAAVDNAGGPLRAGLFTHGVIVTNQRANVLRIPRSAMLTWNPAAKAGVVYVVNGDRAQRRDVSTGASSADTIEIARGLAPGDTVVTRGSFNLRDGDRVSVSGAPASSPANPGV
ncbi:MAG TPA: efflux RND transporter periplasmic adaptor subunit [Thermoanaerobaculia bacterium]|nr:efflux RND transporter periplasmic adaptor subunit [Thermoanaerobaculia bacterium]